MSGDGLDVLWPRLTEDDMTTKDRGAAVVPAEGMYFGRGPGDERLVTHVRPPCWTGAAEVAEAESLMRGLDHSRGPFDREATEADSPGRAIGDRR
jgi:hypothetical protein